MVFQGPADSVQTNRHHGRNGEESGKGAGQQPELIEGDHQQQKTEQGYTQAVQQADEGGLLEILLAFLQPAPGCVQRQGLYFYLGRVVTGHCSTPAISCQRNRS